MEMTDRQKALDVLIKKAIDAFNEHEKYLLTNDVTERSICSKLAAYISGAKQGTEFERFDVDTEWNRGHAGVDGNKKMLPNLKNKIKDITLDIILHRRGYNPDPCDVGYDNQVCIEMKKRLNGRMNNKGVLEDKDRLKKLTKIEFRFGYRLGYMVIADVDNRELVIDEVFVGDNDY